MVFFLGVIAAVLLGLIIAAIAHSNRDDETLAFTMPADLAMASRVASAPLVRPADLIAATSVAHQSFDDVLAEKQAAAATVRSQSTTFVPGNLGVGTALTYRGETSVIRGVLSFDFDGALWQDYLVQESDGDWWRFAVEPDKSFRLAVFTPEAVTIEPGPDTLHFADGVTYHVTDSGQANYRSAGQTSQFETGRYFYFDYENARGQVLGFERFDSGPWHTSIGHYVDPTQVTVCNFGGSPERGGG